MARGQKYSDQIREKALAGLAENSNASAVARSLGVPASTVRDWKKEAERDAEFLRLRKLKQKAFVNDAWSGIESASKTMLKRLKRAEENEDALNTLMEECMQALPMNTKQADEFIKAVRNVNLYSVTDLAKAITTLFDKAMQAAGEENTGENTIRITLDDNLREFAE